MAFSTDAVCLWETKWSDRPEKQHEQSVVHTDELLYNQAQN